MICYLANGAAIVLDNLEYVGEIQPTLDHNFLVGFHQSGDRIFRFASEELARHTRNGLLNYLADYHQRKDIK